MADIKKEYERWLENATADADVATELKTLDDTKIEDAFYRDLAFGTSAWRNRCRYQPHEYLHCG